MIVKLTDQFKEFLLLILVHQIHVEIIDSASKFNLKFKKSNEKASSATNKINETYYSKNNILKNWRLKKMILI